MIKTESYGGGTRWHCTNCDQRHSGFYGGTIAAINWTNGTTPARCSRCEPCREYKIKLELSILLPEDHSNAVREAIKYHSDAIAEAVRVILARKSKSCVGDAKLDKYSVSPKRMVIVMTNPYQDEMNAIDAELDALRERVEEVCRETVESICKREGWFFRSLWSTCFECEVPHGEHDRVGSRGRYFKEMEWPEEFKDVFDWAERVDHFPDMIFEDGKLKP